MATKLQTANTERWNKEGFIKSVCSSMRTVIMQNSSYADQYQQLKNELNLFEIDAVHKIRVEYELIKSQILKERKSNESQKTSRSRKKDSAE